MQRLRKAVETPARRVLLVTTVMALVWGAMVFCQGVRSPVTSADWSLMSEVGRKLALGKTLYVETMDQKGPLVYATYALIWLVARTYDVAFVLSNVLCWLLLTISSAIAARIVEEARRPWVHPLAQALLTAVILVPHVGCVETWLVPFGLAAALWVRRLADGGQVSPWCWVVVGSAAGFALWAKFTCAAQFAFVLAYGLSRGEVKGLGRAAAIALASCLAVSCAVLAWMWLAGSFQGMLEHYIGAATGGYAERMSMVQYLTKKNPSSTHVSSFYFGLVCGLVSLVVVTLTAAKGRRVVALLGSLVLLACCLATFVGYYRFQLAPLVVLAACELRDLSPLARTILKASRLYVGIFWPLLIASCAFVAVALSYSCSGTPGMVSRSELMRKTLRDTVGESDSVIVWQFDHTWAFHELGLDYPYAIPARYNASQDLFDATAGADLAAHRWEYVVVAVTDGVKAGDHVTLADTNIEVLAVAGNMAVAYGAPEGEMLRNEPYQLP